MVTKVVCVLSVVLVASVAGEDGTTVQLNSVLWLLLDIILVLVVLQMPVSRSIPVQLAAIADLKRQSLKLWAISSFLC